jgi:hypothetical protein
MAWSSALLMPVLLFLELDKSLFLMLLLHMPTWPAAFLSGLVHALLPFAHEGRKNELLGLPAAELALLRLDPIGHVSP